MNQTVMEYIEQKPIQSNQSDLLLGEVLNVLDVVVELSWLEEFRIHETVAFGEEEVVGEEAGDD